MSVDTLVTLVSGLGGALLGAWVAHLSAAKYVGKPKLADSALVFSDMFHKLRMEQVRLNEDYDIVAAADTQGQAAQHKIGLDWWHRFFDLMLMQFIFLQEGIASRRLFAQWMVWRYHEYKQTPGAWFSTCGVCYAEGWQYWQSLPGNAHSVLPPYLEQVHRAADADSVPHLVRHWRL